MVWMIGLGVLAAAGVLLIWWATRGWLLLGRDAGGVVVLACRSEGPPPEPFLRCYRWLRGSGLVGMPLVLVDMGLPEARRRLLERLAAETDGAECCTAAELPLRLRMEAEYFGGTGAGNSAGDDLCGGVPEL